MVENVVKVQEKNEELSINPELKVQNYISSDFDYYSPVEVGDVSVSLSSKRKSSSSVINSSVISNSNYLANNAALRNMSSAAVSVLPSAAVTASISSSRSSTLAAATSTPTSYEDILEEYFGSLTTPSAGSDIGTLTNYQIMLGIYALANDTDFCEPFYADRLQDFYRDMFPAYLCSHLEDLANNGDWDELRAQINDLVKTYTAALLQYKEMVAKYPSMGGGQLAAQMAQIEYVTLPALINLSQMSNEGIQSTMFKKVKTPFLIPDAEALAELKEQILFYANMESLVTALSQAKIDGYNTVKQILDNQTGYEKMNIRKINSKKSESLSNYVTTRKKEIYDYVNNYNERVKAELEQKLLTQQDKSETDFFIRAGLGVLSFLGGLIASIFSMGLAAPLVLSSISTTYEIINTNRQAESDINIRQQMEVLEEEMALLRAAENRREKEVVEKRIQKLLEERKISKVDFMLQTGITEDQWNQMVAMGYIDANGYVQEKLYKDPEAFAAAMSSILGVSMGAVMNYLNPFTRTYSYGVNYQEILNMEVMLNNSLTNLNFVQAGSDGYYQFNNQLYLESYMRTQGVASAFRLYQSIIRANIKGRNLVAEELGVGKATENNEFSDKAFKNEMDDVFKALVRMGELQFEKAKNLNRRKELREEIRNLQMSSSTKMLGSIIFQGLDFLTFNSSSLFLQHMLSPLGRGFYDFFTQQDINSIMTYNDRRPQDLASNGYLDSVYQDILSGSTYSDFSLNVTADRHSVNYDQFIAQLKNLEIINIINNMYLSVYGSQINSRSIVHQELTDKKGYVASTDVAAENYQQQNDLVKDLIKKQLQMTMTSIQNSNRKVMADLETTKSGYRLLTSALSGLVGGYSKSTDEVIGKLVASGLGYVLENNSEDFMDLALNNSDFYINANNSFYSSGSNFGDSPLDQEMKSILNPAMFITNDRGQTIVNVNLLSKKIFAVYKIAAVNQVIASLAEARQKARQMIMMILSEKATNETSIAKKQAEITTAAIQDQLDAISQKMMSTADLMSQRNIRLSQAQRNVFTSIIEVGLGSMLIGAYPDKEYFSSATGIAKVMITTGFTVKDISDDLLKKSLDINEALVAANMNVNENLVMGKIEARERELLVLSLQVKQNMGRYGMSSSNTSALQHINILLRKIQLFKQKLLDLSNDLKESVNMVHSTLESYVLELTDLAKQILESNKMFLQSMIAEIKKKNMVLSQQMSQRAKEILQGVSTITENTINASLGMSGLMNDASSKATLNTLNFYLRQLNTSIQGLIKVGMEQMKSSGSEVLPAVGLQSGEVEELLAAQASEETQLLEQSNSVMRDVNKLLNDGTKSIGNILNHTMNKRKLYRQINELLLDERLRRLRLEYVRLQNGREELLLRIRSSLQDLQNNSFFQSHFQTALNLLNRNQPAEALAALRERCTEAFLRDVNPELLDRDAIRSIISDLEQLNNLDRELEITRRDLDQAETIYHRDCERFTYIIDHIFSLYEELTEANKKLTEVLRKYEDPDQQTALNRELQTALGTPSDSIFSENLSTYLQMSEPEARRIESLVSTQQAEDLRTIYNFVRLYRSITIDAILMAKIQDNRTLFNEALSEYNQQFFALNGSASPEYRAFMLTNYFYSNYISRERRMNTMLNDFGEINNLLRGRVNNSSGPATLGEGQDDYSTMLHIGLNKGLYEGIQNYRPIESEEENQSVQAYFDQQWRYMANVIQRQNSVNQRSGLADRWTIYFYNLNRNRVQTVDLGDLETRYHRAEADLRLVERLFATHTEEERIDINIEDLSQEAKGYIMQIVGNNVVYNHECRELILNYLRRKMENLEIQIIQRRADNEFAYEVLNREMSDISSLQEEYNDVWLEYEEAFRTHNSDGLRNALARLNDLKARLDAAELRFQRRREAYQNRLSQEVFSL